MAKSDALARERKGGGGKMRALPVLRFLARHVLSAIILGALLGGPAVIMILLSRRFVM